MLEALVFPTILLDSIDPAPQSTTLDPNHVAILLSGAARGLPLVHVLRDADLTALLGTAPAGLIHDRGTKHPDKGLAGHLAGRRGGVQAIRAAYTDPGQALRGIRSLIDSARKQKAEAAFLLGVSPALFAALHERIARYHTNQPTGGGGGQSLNHSDIEVPASLVDAYVGDSPQMDLVRRAIVLASRVDFPVIIQGETGTGKEIVARQIHLVGPRRSQSCIPVNCGGIPRELFESELFGHVKGSFSGANRDKKGFWTMANRGTLFLDEIGDLTLHHQVKVLRALDGGEYFPVGGEAAIRSSARVIAATNRDLGRMVENGTFREDLYYRLYGFRIRTPALRDHPGDIPLLARYFLGKLGNGHGYTLPDPAARLLAAYHWPGNARELRSFLMNLILVANGRRIDTALVHAVLRDRIGPAMARGRDE